MPHFPWWQCKYRPGDFEKDHIKFVTKVLTVINGKVGNACMAIESGIIR